MHGQPLGFCRTEVETRNHQAKMEQAQLGHPRSGALPGTPSASSPRHCFRFLLPRPLGCWPSPRLQAASLRCAVAQSLGCGVPGEQGSTLEHVGAQEEKTDAATEVVTATQMEGRSNRAPRERPDLHLAVLLDVFATCFLFRFHPPLKFFDLQQARVTPSAGSGTCLVCAQMPRLPGLPAEPSPPSACFPPRPWR